MAHLLLDTAARDYASLIGNGVAYYVPPYQRDYSWTAEQWEDLWSDIVAIQTEKRHYLGYIVLQQQKEGKNYWIIDGQQRFTTLSLISLAAERLLREWAKDPSDVCNSQNNDRADAIHNRFLGNYSASKLTTSSKLFLNKNNNDFYQSHLLALRPTTPAAKLKPSQKLLQKAFEYFYQKLKEKFFNSDGVALAQFIEDEVTPNLIFTTIEIGDELNAYKVFETLNARGVHLSPADLLKNYLFSIAVKNDDTDFIEAERLWQSINDKINDSDLPTFIRHYWNSRHPFARSSELFRVIRSVVKDQKDVFYLLRELDAAADIYAAISDAANPIWADKEQKKSIKVLKLFSVSACYPLLLTAHILFKQPEFTKLLHEIIVLTFRRTVIGNLNTNELETTFNQCSVGIFGGKIKTAKSAYELLKSVTVSDKEFQSAFALKEIPFSSKSGVIRYILAEIETHIDRSNKFVQYDSDNFTVEHILPQTYHETWADRFTIQQHEEYVNRIGNCTLLEREINESLQNSLIFSKKLLQYKTSRYQLTRNELDYDKWDADVLTSHQEKLAEWAVKIWKSNFEK